MKKWAKSMKRGVKNVKRSVKKSINGPVKKHLKRICAMCLRPKESNLKHRAAGQTICQNPYIVMSCRLHEAAMKKGLVQTASEDLSEEEDGDLSEEEEDDLSGEEDGDLSEEEEKPR